MGTPQTSRSIVIFWRSPPCPNSFITGYYIYYRIGTNIQTGIINSQGYINRPLLSTEASLTYILEGLIPGQSYLIHVRAISRDSLVGEANNEIVVVIRSGIPVIPLTDSDGNPVQSADQSTSSFTSSLSVVLPTATAFAQAVGISNLT